MFSTKLFHAATLKLTAWYLLVIMLVSLLFSILVYQTALGELQARVEQFGQNLPNTYLSEPLVDIKQLWLTQSVVASHNIILNLGYINLAILIFGGIASYLMARLTLRPIEESHQAQSRFVSDASHEFRTPLAAMKTELEVAMRAKSLSKKEMNELLVSNLEEVNRLSELSSTLLSLSKMDYSSLTHEAVVINGIVKRTAARFNKSAKRIKFSSKSRRLLVDAHQPSIEELLKILLDNALKYSPENSEVRISLKKHYSKAIIQVKNSGKGISPKDLPHIFDRFYRADDARKYKADSSFGLGLSLAKKIVELHGGELSVTSGVNKETTFSVSLPLIEKNNRFASILSHPSEK